MRCAGRIAYTRADGRRRTLETHLRTAWHPLFIALLEHLLPAGRWRIIAEYLLNHEPRRIDAVILRAADPSRPLPDDWRAPYLRSVLDGLRPYNLVHFKGATDHLERADALQALSYAAQLMIHEGVDDPALVSLRVVAPRITPRFRQQLERLGGHLAAGPMAGVHDGALHGFALRVVEASVAWPNPREHLLYAVTPESIDHPERIAGLDDNEWALYYHLTQLIRRLAESPTWKVAMKDAVVVESTTRRSLSTLLAHIPPAERLAGIPLEERLAGIPLEAVGQALPPDHAVLVLPNEALRALDPAYLATLPDDVQAAVRERLARNA